MAVWLVRAGKYGENDDLALDKGVAVIGWEELEDLSKVRSREELESKYQEAYRDASPNQRTNNVGQLWAFSHRIEKKDLVVLPLKTKSAIAIGRVEGPYQYRQDLGTLHHAVPVQWLRTDFPRSTFDQDLLYSFGAYMTVCQISRNNAEIRIKAILGGKTEPKSSASDITASGSDGVDAMTDLIPVAQGQIEARILAKFKGHGLARLVAGVLRAQGYLAHESPAGPDGGVDILAGSGPLGFSQPRLCVQVKSQDSSADVSVFRSLHGSMQAHQAEQGLLVCWGGFNKAVVNEAKHSFFKIRLWTAADLVQAVVDNYDQLPADIRTELPLKRIWVLVHEE